MVLGDKGKGERLDRNGSFGLGVVGYMGGMVWAWIYPLLLAET